VDLRKAPSISETLDWAKALVSLNVKNLDSETLETTLSVLLKHENDLLRTRQILQHSGKDLFIDTDDPRLQSWKI
jgi:hypothetical protein